MLLNSDDEIEKKTHEHTHTHKEDKIFSEGLLSRKIKIH